MVHVNAGKLMHYAGDYQYYLDKTRATSAREALTAGTAGESRSPEAAIRMTAARAKDQKRLEAEQRQTRSRARKEHQQLVHRLEKEIAELEKKQVELTAELEKPETYQQPGKPMQINRELVHVQERLAELTPEWEAAAVKLETIE